MAAERLLLLLSAPLQRLSPTRCTSLLVKAIQRRILLQLLIASFRSCLLIRVRNESPRRLRW